MSIDTTGTWLPLLDYSTKYEVSESAVQRSIDAKEINYRFEDGKYFIMDEPVGTHQRVHRPSQKSDLALVGAHQGMMKDIGTVSSSYLKKDIEAQEINKIKVNSEEPIINAANKLLYELKKAYSQILQEKDVQLLQLKQEVADFKTLISVLESENEKLKSKK